MGIVDDLVAHPGMYVGVDSVVGSDLRGAARLVVAPLPGGAGVTIDYEILNGATPERVLGHVEHTVLARTHDGGVIMVIGHSHSESLTVLHETEPGTFEIGADGSPFPMKVTLSMPEAGRLRHAWWYGPAGGEAVERERRRGHALGVTVVRSARRRISAGPGSRGRRGCTSTPRRRQPQPA